MQGNLEEAQLKAVFENAGISNGSTWGDLRFLDQSSGGTLENENRGILEKPGF